MNERPIEVDHRSDTHSVGGAFMSIGQISYAIHQNIIAPFNYLMDWIGSLQPPIPMMLLPLGAGMLIIGIPLVIEGAKPKDEDGD